MDQKTRATEEKALPPGEDIAAPPKLLPPGKTEPATGDKTEGPSGGEPPSRRRRWWWIVLLALLAGGIYYIGFRRTGSPPAGGPTAGGRAGRGGRGVPGIVPVVAAKATRGNIGVYLTGLGAVTPLRTVTVRSRVDGELLKVYYREGELVHEGDPLIEIDPRPYQAQLTQYEGQLTRDQALLANARVDLARYETLLKQNAIPEQQVATQRSLVAQYEGNIKTDQGLIETARLNITYSHITAPISGLVGLRLIDPGNIVQASSTTPLVVITQMQPISVIFTIAEDQLQPVLQRYRAGRKLKVDAYSRDMLTKISEGSLTTIDNQIDQSTGTVRLRATFANPHYELYPNQFVNARLLVQEKTGVTLVPSAVVQRNGTMTYVYLVKPDSTVTIRQVGIGTMEGDQTEITSGLNPGDEVVMTGVDKLQEGTKVNAHLEGQGGQTSNQSGRNPTGANQRRARPGNRGTNAPSGGNKTGTGGLTTGTSESGRGGPTK